MVSRTKQSDSIVKDAGMVQEEPKKTSSFDRVTSTVLPILMLEGGAVGSLAMAATAAKDAKKHVYSLDYIKITIVVGFILAKALVPFFALIAQSLYYTHETLSKGKYTKALLTISLLVAAITQIAMLMAVSLTLKAGILAQEGYKEYSCKEHTPEAASKAVIAIATLLKVQKLI